MGTNSPVPPRRLKVPKRRATYDDDEDIRPGLYRDAASTSKGSKTFGGYEGWCWGIRDVVWVSLNVYGGREGGCAC